MVIGVLPTLLGFRDDENPQSRWAPCSLFKSFFWIMYLKKTTWYTGRKCDGYNDMVSLGHSVIL